MCGQGLLHASLSLPRAALDARIVAGSVGYLKDVMCSYRLNMLVLNYCRMILHVINRSHVCLQVIPRVHSLL